MWKFCGSWYIADLRLRKSYTELHVCITVTWANWSTFENMEYLTNNDWSYEKFKHLRIRTWIFTKLIQTELQSSHSISGTQSCLNFKNEQSVFMIWTTSYLWLIKSLCWCVWSALLLSITWCLTCQFYNTPLNYWLQ